MKVQQAEQGIPEQGFILGQCTQIPHYCTRRPLGFGRAPCGYEFSAQPQFNFAIVEFKSQTLCQEKPIHGCHLPPTGQTATPCSSSDRDMTCLFSPLFFGSLCPAQERLHQNPKSYTPITLANDSTIGFIHRKCGKGNKSQPMAPQPCHWPATFFLPQGWCQFNHWQS